MRIVCLVGLRVVDAISTRLLALACWESVRVGADSCGFRRRFLEGPAFLSRI